mgnify:CR=1 FL=1|tara:strand:+ start:7444 stop:7590 length:147 start_codon:yes stop_codon:yes gene_type:complete
MIIGIILGLSALLNIRLAYLVGKGYKWRAKESIRLDDENKILLVNKDE